MSTNRWAAEQEAYRGLADLLAQAERCKELCESAGMALPEPLKRLLGMNEGTAKLPQGVVIDPPPVRSRPPGFSGEWISVDLAKASPITVVPAVLQGRKGSMRAKEIVAKVTELIPTASGGSVANTLNKLRIVGLIDKAEDGGWILKKPEAAALVHDGKLWGPQSAFQKPEVASYRRDAILYLLGRLPSGLQILQIVEHLRGTDWLRAPLNKDLVKEDIKVLLAEKKVRQRGNTRKWELTPPPEA